MMMMMMMMMILMMMIFIDIKKKYVFLIFLKLKIAYKILKLKNIFQFYNNGDLDGDLFFYGDLAFP